MTPKQVVKPSHALAVFGLSVAVLVAILISQMGREVSQGDENQKPVVGNSGSPETNTDQNPVEGAQLKSSERQGTRTGVEAVAVYSVSGRVLGWDGRPIGPFAVICRDASGEGELVHNSFSGELGRFTIDGLRPGEWLLHAESTNNKRSTVARVVVPGNADIDLVCSDTAQVSGRVLGPGEGAVVGAKVSLAGVEATSGAEGVFELEHVPSGGGVLDAVYEGLVCFEPIVLDTFAGEHHQGILVRLQEGGGIKGACLEANGSPLDGVLIEIQRVGFPGASSVETDAEGEFSLKPLAPGTYQVRTRDLPGGLGDFVRLATVAAGEDVNVILRAAKGSPILMTGRVVLRGLPVDGHITSFRLGNSGSDLACASSQVVDGSFRLHLRHPGQYLLKTNTSGGRSAEFVVEVPNQNHWEVELELPEGSISGVLHTESGEVAAGCRVLLERVGAYSAFSTSITERVASVDNQPFSVLSDANGAWVFDGLSPGGYSIRAYGRGWRQEAFVPSARLGGLELKEGEERSGIELTLVQGGTVWLSVKGMDGRPAGEAAIFARDADGYWFNPISNSVTLTNGTSGITDLPPGTYTFVARTRDLVSYESEEVRIPPLKPGENPQPYAKAVDLELRRGVRLTVRVLDAGGEPTAANLMVLDELGRSVSGSISFHDRALVAERGYTLGYYSVGPLPPGAYRVHANSSDGRQISRDVEIVDTAKKEMFVALQL